MSLKTGTQAPDFTLPSTADEDFTLSKTQAGKPCIIYFYPKDFTPVCTKEACEFRDTFSYFRDLDIDVYGISKDSIDTHNKFKIAHDLPFDLLSDRNGKVSKKYKALLPFLSINKRVTYLLDKNHVIVGVYDKLFQGPEHSEAMIRQIKKLGFQTNH